MKSFVSLVATMAFASIALAQDKPAAKPAAPDAAKPAAQEPAKPAVVAAKPAAPMTASRRARRAEDARHCLEKATNNDVIKCAEEYL
jgi:hypothetical protein